VNTYFVITIPVHNVNKTFAMLTTSVHNMNKVTLGHMLHMIDYMQ